MHTYSLSVPFTAIANSDLSDFGTIIEIARERACALDRVVFIDLHDARPGYPNRWAVSPRARLSVEGVSMAHCVGCSE